MKVMTYNVHSCKDSQKNNTIEKIVELLKTEKPVMVGLNEIEKLSPRTRFVNQPRKLAKARDMLFAYGPTLRLGRIGFFGNALLSRYPIHTTQNIRLPGNREPRKCLKTVLRLPQEYITVLQTHLGLSFDERSEQITKLAEIIKNEKNPVILMGDFNCTDDQLGPLTGLLSDTGKAFGAEPTYSWENPSHRIDYILVSKEFTLNNFYIPKCDASDHLPVIAELDIQ